MANSRPTSCGLTLAPLFIRIALAVTFIWAGYNKMFGDFKVKGDDAAILANIGILANPTLAGAAAPATPKTYTASDFNDEQSVRGMWGIALMLHKAAHPAPNADGKTPPAIWPAFLAEGPFPRVLSIAVALAEFLGGIFALVGWFTRFAGLVLTGVMLGAIWLSQIGPNWQTGNLMYGFLPAYHDPTMWTTLLFQFTLLCCAFALFVGGSGRLAIDWALRSAADPAPAPRPAAPPPGGTP